ncbi:MAG: DUF6279 family lipoprotein [Betaproteobacteria bacterium]
MRILAALLALVVLGGCSALRFAYDNADTYLRWRASSYVDLSGEAADELDDVIHDVLAWHRGAALPKYAGLLDEAGRRFGRGLSRSDVEWGYDAVRAQLREALRVAAERAAPMIDRLTPEQIAHLEGRFAEDNRKFAREHLRGSESERREKRVKRMVDRLEDWVGRLTPAQLERVRLYSERAPLLDELRDRDRKRLQREFVGMARAREAARRLPEWAQRWELRREPAYAEANAAWWREVFAMALDLDRMLTPEQRARALSQLRRYAQDVRVLARRAQDRPR